VARGRTVIKQISDIAFNGDEFRGGVFTEEVHFEHLQDEIALRAAPIMLQRLVDKTCDIRVTVVNDSQFAVQIDSQDLPESRIDFRKRQDLPMRAIELPEKVHRGIATLMARTGLHFGALDFALDRSGEYFFLEVNPTGNWLWIEHQLGLDISGQLANALLSL
jgi:glutathione synthase/RimK-type ligase-like ATP-grasp enzyme